MRFLGGVRALGFSLVEIAIVLVVIGLMVSGGLLGLSPVLQANKITQTNATLDKIEQALTLYVIQNGCLPCPANPATLTGRSSTGSASTSEYSSGCSGSATACFDPHGLVPWVNLGLARADVLDAYNAFISYAVTTGTINATSLTNVSTSMTRTPPSSYPVGTISVRDAANTTQTAAAAYVLVSHGADASYAFGAVNGALHTDPNGGSLQTPNGPSGTGPYTITGTFVQNQMLGRGTTNGYFDDIVRFKTAPVLIQGCGSNACGNPA